jgi:hypothetical protein
MNVKNAFSPPLPGFETLFDALSILVLDECDELLRQDGADTRRKGGVTVWGIHDDQPIHKSKPVPEIIDLS